jgi:thiamine-monophosphate kinase
MSEFDLIRRLRQIISAGPLAGRRPCVIGPGDDAAVLAVPPDRQLVVTTDTLVQGVHFRQQTPAADLGHKALAVNLSDLAAMGADPAWFFLALTLPAIDFGWLDPFAEGMASLATSAGIELAGGDTTAGPLSITITALGLVESGQALTRAGAQEGDLVVVSGALGCAAIACNDLAAGNLPDATARRALDHPIPRLNLGRRLNGLATSCIDLSDGLLADLGHILLASGKGAEIELERLPVPACLDGLEEPERLELQTAGGDDYELCFTIPPDRESELEPMANETGIGLTVIGRITASQELLCKTRDGAVYHPPGRGYEHFTEGSQ